VPTLQFKGKTVIETYHHTVPHHRLELVPDLSVLEKGQKPALDGNLIIEGDNLLALKALLPTHAGRVKCIYIDPPYNTGNEAWVYNDNLTQPQFKEWIGQTVGKEGEDACRHDKWCCMMYPRLELLRELVRDDGVIFISIGDDEIGHLRSLLDEVFDEENFIAHICWQKRYVSNVTAQFLSDMHDHILMFARNRDRVKLTKVDRTEEQLKDYQNPDDDPRDVWRAQDLSASKPYKAGVFKIKGPTGRVFSPPPGRYWRCNEEQYKKWLDEGRIWFGKDGTGRPMLKSFLAEASEGVTPNTWWSYQFAGHNKEATLELKKLFDGASPFDTPKPVKLVRRMVELLAGNEGVFLDSFAGSGTTGHAIIESNAADNGVRTFVLVQQPHDTKEDESSRKNIAETVTRERVFRATKQLKRGGSFTYARVGEPLFDEYKQFAKKMPDWEDLAKYIFYTETSREIDLKKLDPETRFIGATDTGGGTSYYLHYTPDRTASEPVTTKQLKELLNRDKRKNWVIYCEKIWVHQDDLALFQRENNKRIRLMQVPFQMK
jgi:adenine-specific DNA-methyltransferase